MLASHKTKNILCIVDELTTGGAQTALFNVVDNLDRNLYTPYVVALFKDGRVGETLRDRGIYVECLHVVQPFSFSTFIKLYPRLCAIARDHNVVLVHSFLTASAIYGGIIARRLRLPSILNVHTVLAKAHIVGKRTTLYLELLARGLNHFLIAGNQMTKAELLRLRLWRDVGRIRMIYNGIAPVGNPSDVTWSGDAIKITMVANFFPEKDHITLIKAYELLRDRFPLQLLIIAEGEGSYRELVMNYVQERDLKQIVFQNNKDAATYSQQTDIFVLTTHSEGDPIVLKEAMSVGIPCVASNVGAVGEVIEDGVDGVLIADGDLDGLVRALIRLIEDRPFRQRLAKCAIKKYRDKFSLDKMTYEYKELYAQVI